MSPELDAALVRLAGKANRLVGFTVQATYLVFEKKYGRAVADILRKVWASSAPKPPVPPPEDEPVD